MGGGEGYKIGMRKRASAPRSVNMVEMLAGGSEGGGGEGKRIVSAER